MATSSSTNFELDVAEYIEEAFERCGLEARTGYDLQTARRSMNIMLAEWANRGLNQWTIEQRTQALTANSTDVLVYDALTRMQDADTQVNTLEIPFRFFPCLTAGLAYYIAMKRAPDRIQLLKTVYEEEFERAMAEDRDRSAFKVNPQLSYYKVG